MLTLENGFDTIERCISRFWQISFRLKHLLQGPGFVKSRDYEELTVVAVSASAKGSPGFPYLTGPSTWPRFTGMKRRESGAKNSRSNIS